ncbi:MAG: EamA family transporter [Acidimicrobiales bacterium]
MQQCYTKGRKSFRWCYMIRSVMLQRMNRRDTALAALVVTIWGFNFLVIDWGMTGVPPLLFAAVRFTVVLLPAVFIVPKPDAPWRTILGVGTFMSLGQFGFLYSSIHAGMPPGIAALVLQAHVILTVVIAAGVLREFPSRHQVVGVSLGSLGLIIVGFGRGGRISGGALALCLLAGLSWAIGSVISRSSGIPGGLSLTVWSALVVPLPLFVLSVVLDGPGAVSDALLEPSWKSIVSTLYTACLASLFGYAVFNGLLSRYPSSAVVPWSLWGPVVAMTASWFLLGDKPNGPELLGGVLLLVGVLVALRPTPRRRQPLVGEPGEMVATASRAADSAGGSTSQ